MQKWILAAALSALTACSSSTGPGTAISVRVVDDIGDPVFRNRVTIAFDGREPVSALTGHDGVARIGVEGTGEYVVRVTPRMGYVGGAAPVEKSVSVQLNSVSTVDFTIFRAGFVMEPPAR
jgi:hypothetical protein